MGNGSVIEERLVGNAGTPNTVCDGDHFCKIFSIPGSLTICSNGLVGAGPCRKAPSHCLIVLRRGGLLVRGEDSGVEVEGSP